MYSYQDKLKEGDGKLASFRWQLLSFFALEAEEQIALIGPCEPCFLDEHPDINPGANYLKGMAILFEEHGAGRAFDEWAPAEGAEMSRVVKDMFWTCPDTIWTQEALHTGEHWQSLRLFAREILKLCGLHANPRTKPYDYARYLELYAYRR